MGSGTYVGDRVTTIEMLIHPQSLTSICSAFRWSAHAVALVLFLLIVPAGFAQVPDARLTEARVHEDPSARIVHANVSTSRSVAVDGSDLIFRSGSDVVRRQLRGRLIGVTAGASGDAVGALVRAADDSLAIRVFTSGGDLLLERGLPARIDDSRPEVALADAGAALAYALPSTAQICFVGATGRDRCERLFEDAEYATERSVRIAFSPDGRYLAVAAQREPARPDLPTDRANAALFLFDREGVLLWTAPLAEPSVRALAFAAEQIAVSTYDGHASPDIVAASQVFTPDAAEVLHVPVGANSFLLADDELMLVSRDGVASYSLETGLLRRQHRLGSQEMVVSADVADGEMVAVLVGRPVHTSDGFAYDELRLRYLDEQGAVAASAVVGNAPSTFARVSVDAAGRAAVTLDDAIHFFTRGE